MLYWCIPTLALASWNKIWANPEKLPDGLINIIMGRCTSQNRQSDLNHSKTIPEAELVLHIGEALQKGIDLSAIFVCQGENWGNIPHIPYMVQYLLWKLLLSASSTDFRVNQEIGQG